MKRIFMGLGSIASVVAPVSATISSGHETRATDPLTTEYVYQWGVGSLTIDAPQTETLDAYIARKSGMLILHNKQGALNILNGFQSTHPEFRFYVGTQVGFEAYKLVLPIQEKADKGQEVQNAIELNAVFREFVRDLMDETDYLIKGNLKDMILYPTDPIHKENYEKHTKLYRAYLNMFKSIVKFERGIAITTNIDPAHPVSIPNLQDMVNVASAIKANEPELWKDIVKMLKVEEAYEPKSVIDAWIALEKAMNPHIEHFNTLAGEMANAHTASLEDIYE